MSCSPYRRGRLRQVEKWLRQEFPTPFPTSVRVQKKNKQFTYLGFTYRQGNKIFILIWSGLAWHSAVETLLHEWAHAQIVTFDHVEASYKTEHDENWAIHYGKIYRAFFDDGGWQESRHFTVEKKFRRAMR